MPKVSHFALLNVARDATPEDIKKAFKKLSLVYHSDKFHAWLVTSLDKNDALDIYKQLTEASQTLQDVDRRRDYQATFQPLPATAADELFHAKWERLQQQYTAYAQRTLSGIHYAEFLQDQMRQLQLRQQENTQQLELMQGHLLQFQKLLQAETRQAANDKEEISRLKVSLAQACTEMLV